MGMPMTRIVKGGSKRDGKTASASREASSPASLASDPFRPNTSELNDLAASYLELLLQGDRLKATHIIMESVDRGMSVRDVYLSVFQPVQREIGLLWQAGLVSVALEHFCTAATQAAMSQLFPHILASRASTNGLNMVGCCVGQELHELGMRMVCDFFEMDGWETHYLGASRPIEQVVAALELRAAHLLRLSVTMPQNLGNAKEMIQAVTSQFPGVKVLVGGGSLPAQSQAGRLSRGGWLGPRCW